MFIHSVPVPRVYKTAAKQLREVKEKGTSLKQVVYNKNRARDIHRVFHVVSKALEHFSEIDAIIEKSELLVKETKFDPWLARILIAELLWLKKELGGESKPVKTILSYRAVLEEHKAIVESETTTQAVKKVLKPRYVRINTLAVTVEEAINQFRDEGWRVLRSNPATYEEFLSTIASLEEGQFMIDLHIKELLLFPVNTQFYKNDSYKKGLLILQDKASCLPVHLLNPPPGSTVLDMCAAPGNKTTHVAALLKGQGTVYAVERHRSRFNTLKTMTDKLNTPCIKTINKDVLKVTAAECPNVEYILVDPSCSGSGMTDRITVDGKNEEPSLERLQKLANLQITILKHALTHFPEAKRVVYSTCSVYSQENEYVVSEVLKNNISFKLVSARALLNGLWKNPTKQDMITEYCISTKPEKDLTNGFFVAVFEREESQKKNDGLNEKQEDDNVNLKKKKTKKIANDLNKESSVNAFQEHPPDDTPNKKKKGKKSKYGGENDQQELTDVDKQTDAKIEQTHESSPKKNKKNQKEVQLSLNEDQSMNFDEFRDMLNSSTDSLHTAESGAVKMKKKKQKKRKPELDDEQSVNEMLDCEQDVQKSERKRKKIKTSKTQMETAINQDEEPSSSKKKTDE